MTPQPTTSAVALATGRADRLLDLDRPHDLATTVLNQHVNDHGLAAHPVAVPEPAAAASAVPTRVVVAPEIAVQIVAAFTSGTSSLAALAHQWHLTPGEVARVVADQPHAAVPEVAPEVRVPRPRCGGRSSG